MKKIVHANSYRPRLRLNCIYNIVNYSNMMKKRDNKSKQEIIRDDVRKHVKIQYFQKVRKSVANVTKVIHIN